mgnify:CR=1 FL=1
MSKTLLCFTNSFGYGPSGSLRSLLAHLAPHWQGDIYVFSSRATQTLFADLPENIKWQEVNERHELTLQKNIEKHPNAYVISSLNRFALSAAKKAKRPIVFFDSLAWMWPQIPSSYLQADRYYCYDMPGVEDKISSLSPEDRKKAVILPWITRRIQANSSKKGPPLFYCGGLKNPYQSEILQKAYSKITAHLVKTFNSKKRPVIATDIESQSIYKKYLPDDWPVKDLPHKDFLSTLQSTESAFVTSGFNISKECLVYKVPYAHLLPTNYSQWQQLQLFEEQGLAYGLHWQNYCSDFCCEKASTLSEKEFIKFLAPIAKKVSNDELLLLKISEDLKSLTLKTNELVTSRENYLKKQNKVRKTNFLEDLDDLWGFLEK